MTSTLEITRLQRAALVPLIGPSNHHSNYRVPGSASSAAVIYPAEREEEREGERGKEGRRGRERENGNEGGRKREGAESAHLAAVELKVLSEQMVTDNK